MTSTEINTLSAILSANGDRVTVEPCAEGAIVRGTWSAGPTDALETALSSAGMRVDALRSDELGLTVSTVESADGDTTGYAGAVFYRMSDSDA
jgi:hypothetical protein